MLAVSSPKNTVKVDQSTTSQQGSADESESYVDGRKVALEPDVILSILSNDLPVDHYINTLVEVSKLSMLTVLSFNNKVQEHFDGWLHGEYCPYESIDLTRMGFRCLCNKVHQQRPHQKLGGIYDENRIIVKDGRKKRSVTESTLSLAACSLIGAEIRPHEAENEYKLAIKLLNEAYSKNKEVAIQRIQSWLIQYAFANDIVKRCSWLESIKTLKSTMINKFSDVWHCVLIGSGFYKGSEVFASPLILQKELPYICFMSLRLNDFYPRTAFADPILHFSRTDLISDILYGLDSFSLLSSDYKILVTALHKAIFNDTFRRRHHAGDILTKISKSINVDSQSRQAESSFYTMKRKNVVTNVSQYTVSPQLNENFLISQTDYQRVMIKKGSQPETSYTLYESKADVFSEPKDIETAITILFRIMSYEKYQYKTFLYNTTNYKDKLIRCYRLLSEHCNDESLPLPLFGYINFLLGWMHEENLVEHPAIEKIATFYENAASKQQFLPLLKRAGDIYENIGDLQSAHRCFSTLHKTITDICDIERKMPNFKQCKPEETQEHSEDDEVKLGWTIGYLSDDFIDILATKVQFLEIKKEKDKYLCHLPAEEVQSYIEEIHGSTPPIKELQKLTFSNKEKIQPEKEVCPKISTLESVVVFTDEPKKPTIKAEVNQNIAISFDEASELDEHPETEKVESIFTPRGNKKKRKKKKKARAKVSESISVVNVTDDLKKPTITAQINQSTAMSSNKVFKFDEHPKTKKVTTVFASVFQDKDEGACNTRLGATSISSTVRNNTLIANSITNLLSINWDYNVKLTIAELQKSKKEGLDSHHNNINKLNEAINKITRSNRHKARGVEALMEHLAWEHIYCVSNGGSRGMMKDNLNKAKELLLMTLNKKINLQYHDVPDTKQLECDVLHTLEQVKNCLSQDVINEWLFGITCQARSMAHVFSQFKAIYPKNKNFVKLYRSWYALKNLYPYNKAI